MMISKTDDDIVAGQLYYCFKHSPPLQIHLQSSNPCWTQIWRIYFYNITFFDKICWIVYASMNMPCLLNAYLQADKVQY